MRAQAAEESFPGEIARAVEEIDKRAALAEATNLQSQLDAIPTDLGGTRGSVANTPLIPPRDGEQGGAEATEKEKTMEERMAEARQIPASHVV